MVTTSSKAVDAIDRSKVQKVIDARKRLMQAGANEAVRLGRDVDPKDRTVEQQELIDAFINTLEIRQWWNQELG